MKTTKSLPALTLITLVLSFTIPGCKKFLQIEPPKTKAELSRVFTDPQTADAAASGLYNQMVANYFAFCNGGITIYTGLSADELLNLSPSASDDPFKNNAILANNPTIFSTFWSDPYKNIYHANAVLEGLAQSSILSLAVKEQLAGEMLYVRALHYFYLVNLFGDIPLQTGTDYSLNAAMPRSSLAKVYEQMVSDLTAARTLLANSYPHAVNTRPNKDAATAMLARVYLFQKKWTEAEAMATAVIEAKKYQLENLDQVFLANSKEVIFQLMKSNTNTAEASIFIPYANNIKPTYAITPELLLAFESGDKRKEIWLKNNLVEDQRYYYPFKYKVSYSSSVTEFNVVQRFAELYLIRSEARTQLENLSGAIADVDEIRARAGIDLISDINPEISKTDLLATILKERQTEFFAEWGHRWLDLKRTGKANEILQILKSPNWQLSDLLYPIPLSELESNTALTQNPGYLNHGNL